MKDKYKPWPLLNLLVALIISRAVPLLTSFMSRKHTINTLEESLLIYFILAFFIILAFFGRDRWCCSKKDEQIEGLEPDALKYRENHETEFNELKAEIRAMKANEYEGKHGMQQANNKLN